MRRDRGRDPRQRLGGVDAVGVRVARADAVRDERVDADHDIRATDEVGSTGVSEARAALVGVELDELVADGVVTGHEAGRREESVADAPGLFLQFGSHGPPPLMKSWTP